MVPDADASESVRRRGGYPPVADLDEALGMIGRREAFWDATAGFSITGPIAQPVWTRWLLDHPDLPALILRCGLCDRRWGHWNLDHGAAVAMPADRLNTQPGEIGNYTDKIVARKGPIIDSATHDTRGTITYRCTGRGCSHAVALPAEERTVLYLNALRANEKLIQL
jgi:hypothetical protein